MKIGSSSNFQGSFGIPQHLKEAEEEFRQKKADREARPDFESEHQDTPPAEMDEEYESGEQIESEIEARVKMNPIEALEKDFGIKFEDEDFQKILFKGYLEKDIVAVPSIRGIKPLVVTLKSLNGEEYDLVDELLAEDIRDVRMTNDGFSTRRNMWILAIAVTKIQGKPICVQEFTTDASGKKEVDVKATVRRKRSILAKLNAAVITRIMRIHGQLTLAINAIMEDPEADFLKKP
jgi:hypothetical protein